MLVAQDGDDHDPGQHLHAELRLLRGADRPPDRTRPGRTAPGGRGDPADGVCARGDHFGGARRIDDGGAAIWAETIRAVREENPQTAIEVLIPDFKGRWQDLETVLAAKPDILNHNVETVPRLHKQVRPQAKYERSLEMLRRAKAAGFVTKSGLMLGIGEHDDEIASTLRDMAADKLDILTLGQYLRPSAQHLPLYRWVTPEEFSQAGSNSASISASAWSSRGRWCAVPTMPMNSPIRSCRAPGRPTPPDA
jgi:hypothetical protein